MRNQNQGHDQVEVQPFREPSEDAQELLTFFTEIERKQIDFLNESGKSLVERISTFLALLLGASVLSNTFPATYLKGDVLARVCIIVALGAYLCAMGAALWAIQPRFYRRSLYNTSELGRERERITRQKMRWLRLAGIFFLGGSIFLAALIVNLVWKMTQ